MADYDSDYPLGDDDTKNLTELQCALAGVDNAVQVQILDPDDAYETREPINNFWNTHKAIIEKRPEAQKLQTLMHFLDPVLRLAHYRNNDNKRGFIINIVYLFIRTHDMFPSLEWIKGFQRWPLHFNNDYFPWMFPFP